MMIRTKMKPLMAKKTKPKTLTKKTAIKRFIATQMLDTSMLAPLGISFETFLRFTQKSDLDRSRLTVFLVDIYKSELRDIEREEAHTRQLVKESK